MDIYGPYAWQYDALSTDFVKTLENNFRRKLLARFVPSGSDVLDLGCGTGATHALLNSPKSYTGIDISAPMLDVAQRKLPERSVLIHHDLSKGMPKLEGTFDSMVSLYSSLSHLTESEFSVLLKDTYQTLRPGGSIVLDVMNRYSLERLLTGKWMGNDYYFSYIPDKPKAELEFYTPARIRALFETAGFRVSLITSATVVPARGLFGMRSLCNKYRALGASVYSLEVLLKNITNTTGPKLGRALIVVATKL